MEKNEKKIAALQQALVDVIRTEISLATPSMAKTIRERGGDADKVFAEIRAERQQLRDLGILSDSATPAEPKPVKFSTEALATLRKMAEVIPSLEVAGWSDFFGINLPGLMAPPVIPAPRDEEWRIRISGERYEFSRYVHERCDECYRPASAAEAAVWAAAIIQGFEPPRHLKEADRPAA